MTSIEDRVLDGPHGLLTVRVYRPQEPGGPGLVWLHGGAFMLGDLDMPESDAVARRLAQDGVTVVSVDYRLAPLPAERAAREGLAPRDGFHHPVPSDEAAAAFAWAAEAGLAAGPWAIGGASAGGNLAAAAALRLEADGGPMPGLVILVYPTLHARQPTQTPEIVAALDADPVADRYTSAHLECIYENYLGALLDAADEFAIPGLAAPDCLRRFPETLILASEADELRISAHAFADALQGAGARVVLAVETGTRHGHLNRPDEPGFAATVGRMSGHLLALC